MTARRMRSAQGQGGWALGLDSGLAAHFSGRPALQAWCRFGDHAGRCHSNLTVPGSADAGPHPWLRQRPQGPALCSDLPAVPGLCHAVTRGGAGPARGPVPSSPARCHGRESFPSQKPPQMARPSLLRRGHVPVSEAVTGACSGVCCPWGPEGPSEHHRPFLPGAGLRGRQEQQRAGARPLLGCGQGRCRGWLQELVGQTPPPIGLPPAGRGGPGCLRASCGGTGMPRSSPAC